MQNNMDRKPTISERVNAKLAERPGEVFKDGKWRFWFVFILGLAIINSILTALIFAGTVGGVALALGALVAWVIVGAIYYSDSEDTRMAQGVSLLDSFTLGFTIVHLCFLMWVYGHLLTMQGADAKYEAQVKEFNDRAERIGGQNIEIAKSAEKISENNVRAERLRNDAAYQLRRAAESGARVAAGRQAASAAGVSPSLSTTPIELEKPKAPEESAVAYLSRWDAWIRFANFGELGLAAITLIYIRNRSAKFNGSRQNAHSEPLEGRGEDFPVATVSHRQPAAYPALRRTGEQKSGPEIPVATGSMREGRVDALNRLRAHLKEIKKRHGLRPWFKADLIDGGVSIRLCEREEGRENTIAQTWQSNKILDAVDKPDFRPRLIAELIHQGFPIGKGSAR